MLLVDVVLVRVRRDLGELAGVARALRGRVDPVLDLLVVGLGGRHHGVAVALLEHALAAALGLGEVGLEPLVRGVAGLHLLTRDRVEVDLRLGLLLGRHHLEHGLLDLVEDRLVLAAAAADEALEGLLLEVLRRPLRVGPGQGGPHLDVPAAVDLVAVEQRPEGALLERHAAVLARDRVRRLAGPEAPGPLLVLGGLAVHVLLDGGDDRLEVGHDQGHGRIVEIRATVGIVGGHELAEGDRRLLRAGRLDRGRPDLLGVGLDLPRGHAEAGADGLEPGDGLRVALLTDDRFGVELRGGEVVLDRDLGVTRRDLHGDLELARLEVLAHGVGQLDLDLDDLLEGGLVLGLELQPALLERLVHVLVGLGVPVDRLRHLGGDVGRDGLVRPHGGGLVSGALVVDGARRPRERGAHLLLGSLDLLRVVVVGDHPGVGEAVGGVVVLRGAGQLALRLALAAADELVRFRHQAGDRARRRVARELRAGDGRRGGAAALLAGPACVHLAEIGGDGRARKRRGVASLLLGGSACEVLAELAGGLRVHLALSTLGLGARGDGSGLLLVRRAGPRLGGGGGRLLGGRGGADALFLAVRLARLHRWAGLHAGEKAASSTE